VRGIPTFVVNSLNPRVWVRSAWIEPTHDKSNAGSSDTSLLPIGDAIAFEFGNGHWLVCTPHSSLKAESVYARWIPITAGIGSLIGYQASGNDPIQCNGRWYEFSNRVTGRASKSTEPSGYSIVVGERELHLIQGGSVNPSLIVRNTFGLVEVVQVQANEGVDKQQPSDFCSRYPPQYPKDESQAWGWLLPTAKHRIEAQSFPFTSVMHFALNPVLRKRTTGNEGQVIDEISERLAFGAEYLIAQNEGFAKLLKRKNLPVEQLSEQAPEEHQPYWRVFLKARQQAP
jgi:hypothetical protein